MAVTRASTNILFPPEVSRDIWAKALEESLVMRLGTQIVMPASGGEIQTITGEPVAAWVAEAGRKPVSEHTFGKKTFKPYKAAVIESFSDEFKRDKAALYAMLRPRLANALVTLFDNAVLHGITPPGAGFDHLGTIQTSVFNGTYDDAVNALAKVALADSDVTTWALTPGVEIKLLQNKDTTGRPLWIGSVANEGSVGNLLGRPIVKHTRAGSKSTTAPDTVGVAGAFSELGWGYVEGISYEEYDGPIYSGSTLVHAGRQDNMTSLIVEFEIGSLIRDLTHFVRLVEGTGTTPETPDTP